MHELLQLILSKEGLFGRYFSDFEERPEQTAMAKQVLDAYREDKIALIEAGTGIGKSFAYLVPAVLWALKHKEKTVIATNTIALQEQLVQKDIPFLLKILDAEIEAVLVKGMSNYVCLRKVAELSDQPLLFSQEESEEVGRIERWLERAKEGSRSEISFYLSPGTWEKVAAEKDTCSHVKCPHYKQCFFFKARRKVEEGQLLIVNHHLLLADLTAREEKNGEGILPEYERLVLDEAHHLESVAIDCLTWRLDRIALHRLLARIHSDQHPERSRLALIVQDLPSTAQPKHASALQVELPAAKRNLTLQIDRAFDVLKNVRGSGEKCRVTAALTALPGWTQEIKMEFTALSETLKRFAHELSHLETLLLNFDDKEKFQAHAMELHAVANKLTKASVGIEQFFAEKSEEVRWIEFPASNAALVMAPLDISDYLREHLFHAKRTTALCSATLSTNQNFQFLRSKLGLESEKKKIEEAIYHSPFDFESRALLLIPRDLPEPNHPSFLSLASDRVLQALHISKGNAFVLFTSYDMLQRCYEQVLARSPKDAFFFLKQGDAPRNKLIEQFKSRDRSVLFGTDSFWEGVDVAGEALRCVILMKLPFRVPDDPRSQAYAEYLEREGKDPFNDDALPQAVVKFKQGFGRLMRKKNDRGCVLCLDVRLATKGYGKAFLKSLPNCKKLVMNSPEVFVEMADFYKRTTCV